MLLPLQVADHQLLDAGVRGLDGLAQLLQALRWKCEGKKKKKNTSCRATGCSKKGLVKLGIRRIGPHQKQVT